MRSEKEIREDLEMVNDALKMNPSDEYWIGRKASLEYVLECPRKPKKAKK